MTVTFQDELGLVSVKVDEEYGVNFGSSVAYFTDENGNDYKVNMEYLISIVKEQ